MINGMSMNTQEIREKETSLLMAFIENVVNNRKDATSAEIAALPEVAKVVATINHLDV